MKVRVSEATGVVLDWMVAKCENLTTPQKLAKYSTSWAQGGPIIEREKIAVNPCASTHPETPWFALSHTGTWTLLGPTPLSAAMRCSVSSKLGEEVEVPDELA